MLIVKTCPEERMLDGRLRFSQLYSAPCLDEMPSHAVARNCDDDKVRVRVQNAKVC